MKKSPDNPYGLTTKQYLSVRDMVQGVEEGKGINATASHAKYYDVSSKKSASVIAARNMNNADFRKALVHGLEQKNIIGADSKVEQRLSEGLDAKSKDRMGGESLDRDTILKYIKEINKISGAYAPQKTQSMNLRLDMSGKELDQRIAKLQQELGGEEK